MIDSFQKQIKKQNEFMEQNITLQNALELTYTVVRVILSFGCV